MNEIALVARLEMIPDNPAFRDASADELRVLVAVASVGASVTDYETLAELAGVSLARAKSAVTLFCEAGILGRVGAYADVSDEFAVASNIDTSLDTAREIRDSGLRELIEECANIIGVPALHTDDVKAITSLYSDGGFTIEYILELTAYLASKIKGDRRLTSRRIVSEANKLKEKGIDTHESLEVYLIEKEKEIKDEWEYRRAMGIKGTLSEAERKYIDKWAHEYDFSTSIVSLCYGITRLATGGDTSYQYMDAVLTGWYEAGCRTLEECKIEAEKTSQGFKEKFAKEDKKTKKDSTRAAETPKYSDFNSDDALMKALERSYGKKD